MPRPLQWLASLPGLIERASPARLIAPPRTGLIGPVELPAHDALLDTEVVQWWYWTGHLTGRPRAGDGPARDFGFELVFFVFDAWKYVRSQLGQAAITDRAGQRFFFGESLVLGLPEKEPGKFTLVGDRGEFTAHGGDGHDRLAARLGPLSTDPAFELAVASRKPAALHYGGFPHPLRCGGFTYYYSRTEMATTGTLALDGVTYDVTGTTWFDRQYGELFQLIDRGWQWFALSFADGTQVMLFDFPPGDEQVENTGAVITRDGGYRSLPARDFKVTVLDTWESPHTGTKYPARWLIEAGDRRCEVVPWVRDQELRPSPSVRLWLGPEYWEGACDLLKPGTTEVIGRAYVELNGYAASGTLADGLAFLSELFD